jgi:hypothetical protein
MRLKLPKAQIEAHVVPTGYVAQAEPSLLHVPFVPQEVAPLSVHALTQQICIPVGPTQLPLPHWLLAVQATPSAFPGVQVPPFAVVSQKAPVPQSASLVHAAHAMLVQRPLVQSLPAMHVFAFAHRGQASWPPQSTSVSMPSLRPSMHDAATHMPLPSQTVPPLSVHVAPLAAGMVPQQPAAHVATTHLVLGGGQSLGEAQAETPAMHPPPVPASAVLMPPLPPVPVLDVADELLALAGAEPPCGPPPEPGCSAPTPLVPHDPIPAMTPTATRP